MVKMQNEKPSNKIEDFGATGGIRTPDLPVRSRTLYPAKLQLHNTTIIQGKLKIFNRKSKKILQTEKIYDIVYR